MYIQDDFCPDKKILLELSKPSVWQSMVGKSCWWDGWWKSDSRNIWEHIIKMIWLPRGVENHISGFEYWCNILSADDKNLNHLGWHRDKDEKLKEDTGKIISPLVGTIFYGFPHELEGGFLEISCEDTFTDIERIFPKYNRIIIMDVSKQHRVSRIYKGKRFGFQINLWKSKPTTFLKEDIVLN